MKYFMQKMRNIEYKYEKQIKTIAPFMAICLMVIVTCINTVSASTLESAVESASTGVLEKIVNIYRKIALPVGMGVGVLWAVVNEKRKEGFKKVFLGIVVVYILTYFVHDIPDWISNFVSQYAGNGTTTETITATPVPTP